MIRDILFALSTRPILRRRQYIADKILSEIVSDVERCSGQQAHQILPVIWPKIEEAYHLYKKEPET